MLLMLQSIIIIKDKNIKKNSLLPIVNLEDEKKTIPFDSFFLLMYILYHIENHISRENRNICIMSKKVKNYRKNLLLFMFLSIHKKRRDKI